MKTTWKIILLVFLLILVFARFKTGTFSILPETNFVQYYGTPTQPYQDNLIVSMNPTQVGDYIINMEKVDNYQKFMGCKTNTCSGAAYSLDAYNCTIWLYTMPAGTRCDNYADYRVQQCCQSLTSRPSSDVVCNIGGAYPTCTPGFWDILHCAYTPPGTVGYCGGANLQSTWGCAYKYIVTKSGIVVANQSAVYIDSYQEVLRPDITISFDSGNEFAYSACNWIQNNIKPKIPVDAFTFALSTPKAEYVRGEQAQIFMNVTNNYVNALTDVNLNVCQPTFAGQYCRILSQGNIVLYKGIPTTIVFNIPTNFIVSNLTVTPQLFMKIDTNSYTVSNVNVDCIRKDGRGKDGTLDRITDCAYIDIGDWQGSTRTITIFEKPVGQVSQDFWAKLSATWNSFVTWVAATFGW